MSSNWAFMLVHFKYNINCRHEISAMLFCYVFMDICIYTAVHLCNFMWKCWIGNLWRIQDFSRGIFIMYSDLLKYYRGKPAGLFICMCISNEDNLYMFSYLKGRRLQSPKHPPPGSATGNALSPPPINFTSAFVYYLYYLTVEMFRE